ncbi:PepSY-associated TM helix domain-containing protein [Thalassolituus sp.]|uniref:PepSY-associated TM helix domain-containing protein n=1 Tax=Thalassolituus sp. TaxID=2030822 RepID=UPI002A81A09F|nr:PepSY-associated TM helix domain-containing protein [Thalassolituus sp.]
MSRKLLVTIHLYLAAFFAPIIVIMAASGGLYLFGVKGEMTAGESVIVPDAQLTKDSAALDDQVRTLLEQAGIDADFEYVKVRSNEAQTRPTSRDYYQIKNIADGVEITAMSPDLQASLMELHKGHGPSLYKWLEKAFAAALILIMLSGLYLGLQSPMLKQKTMVLSGAGLLVFVVLALL